MSVGESRTSEYRKSLARFAEFHARELAKIDPATDFADVNADGLSCDSLRSRARHHMEMLYRINRLMDVEYALGRYRGEP